MMDESEQRYLDTLKREHEYLIKDMEDRIEKYNRLVDENRMLKECVVRMCLGRYGVLNE